MSSILIPSLPTGTGTGSVSSLRLNGQIYEPVNGVLEVAVDSLRAFKGFDPLDLPALIQRFDQFAAQSSGIATVTLDQLRHLENPVPSVRYWLLDEKKQGMWFYDPTDTVSQDDTGLTLVSASGKRYKRIFEDSIRLSWFGISTGSELSGFLPNIGALLNAKGYSNTWLDYEPTGYICSSWTILNPYGLRMRCPNGQASIYFPNNRGLWIAASCEFENISFVGNRGATDVVGSDGAISNNSADYLNLSTVSLSAVSKFKTCRFDGSRGNGIEINGNIGLRNEMFPYGSNTSLSIFDDCRFSSNRGNGMYVEGYDANQILFSHYDSRDNGLYNLYDNSFLGCQFVDSGHCNAGRLGHLVLANPNNRSFIAGHYEEDGPPGDYLEGRYTIVGSRLASLPDKPIHVGSLGLLLNP